MSSLQGFENKNRIDMTIIESSKNREGPACKVSPTQRDQKNGDNQISSNKIAKGSQFRKQSLVYIQEETLVDLIKYNENQSKYTEDSIFNRKTGSMENQRNDTKCGACINSSANVNKGKFLCYTCELYICNGCSFSHNSHHIVDAGYTDKEMMRHILMFVDGIFDECERETKLMEEHVEIKDRIDIKFNEDTNDCDITGFCLLDDKSWLICDYENKKLKRIVPSKAMSQSSESLQTLGTYPYDVTEFKITQNIFSSYALVTLPYKNVILVVKIENSLSEFYQIEVNRSCWTIEYFNGLIFTIYKELPIFLTSYHSILTLNTQGQVLRTTDTRIIDEVPPQMAHLPERIYLNSCEDRKIRCMRYDGWFFEMRTPSFRIPSGITCDGRNRIYVSSYEGQIYQLNPNLKQFKRLLNGVKMGSIRGLRWYKDKLYVWHAQDSDELENTISVITIKGVISTHRCGCPNKAPDNVNECLNPSLNNCHPDATCMDLPVGFKCTCNDGFTGSGTDCSKLCGSSTCTGLNRECYKTEECLCVPGFHELDGDCVASCDDYGNTYIDYPDSDFTCSPLLDIVFIFTGGLDNCKAACTSNDDCISFTFDMINGICLLRSCDPESSNSPLDTDPLSEGLTVSVRNCELN